MSGKGKLKTPKGVTYDGEWKNGQMNGKGTLTSADGTKHTGTFKNGELVKLDS